MIASSSSSSSPSSSSPSSSSPSVVRSFSFQPFLYYKKPAIGSVSSFGSQKQLAAAAPVQILFPSGRVGVGIPAIDSSLEDGLATERHGVSMGSTTVICSGPEYADLDRSQYRSLLIAFFCLAIINMTVTCFLFSRADISDSSHVGYPAIDTNITPSAVPHSFQAASSFRRSVEKSNFAWIILTLILGIVSAYFESAIGLSSYCLSVLLNFLLSIYAIPNFVFSFRYIFDAFMIYFALILRSKIVLHFLPVVQPLHSHQR